MSASWTIGSYIFAELDIMGINGNPGLGFYRLIADIDITMHNKQPSEEVGVTDIGADLFIIEKDNNRRLVGRMRRQGPDYPFISYPNTQKMRFQLEIELDNNRIEAIERIRQGGKLNFEMNMYAIASLGQERRSQSVQSSLRYPVNQGTWIEMLDQMGYRKTLLLEIPLTDDIGLHPEALAFLNTAQTHLLRGHYRDAVGACRNVLEALSKELGDEKDILPDTIKSWFEGSNKMSKDERTRLVRRALKILTHPAHHADEVASKMEWELEDAKAILIFSAAMVQMAGNKE
jgi:hypothetical protein